MKTRLFTNKTIWNKLFGTELRSRRNVFVEKEIAVAMKLLVAVVKTN